MKRQIAATLIAAASLTAIVAVPVAAGGPRVPDALVGDAARGMHPLAGQGLNVGLRDVAALAEVLIDDLRLGQPVGGALALARFQRWRRFDGVQQALTFDGINRVFGRPEQLVRVLRDAGLAVVDRLPMLKGQLVREAAGLTGDVPRLLRGSPL